MLFVLGLYSLLMGLFAVVTAQSGRELQAASLKGHLKRRSEPFSFSNEAVLSWADDVDTEKATCFGANIRVMSTKPILVLEDMEDYLSAVLCTSNTMILRRAAQTDHSSLGKVHDLVGGHVITSHASCNGKGERATYQVLSVADLSKDTVTLSIVRAQWQTSFDSIKIDLGYTSDPLEPREHENHPRRNLQARQAAGTMNPSQLASAIPTLSQSAPTSVDTAAPTSTRINLATTILNQVIPLETNTPLQVTCVECSMEGNVDVVAAQFTFTSPSLTHPLPVVVGGASITAHGVKAHIKLSTTIKQSWSFMKELFLASSQTFRIPGVGSAAVLYGPFLAGGYDYNGQLSLTEYGFDMTVPEGAQASFSVDTNSNNEVNATQTQWDQTTFKALPWNAGTEITQLGLWLALRTTFQAKFTFQDNLIGDAIGSNFLDKIDFRAGIFIDTPIINATAKQVSGVKNDCSAGGSLQNALGIDFSSGWDFGAYVSAFYDSQPLVGDGTAESTHSGSFVPVAAAKQCLQFDANSNSYTIKTGAAVRGAAGFTSVLVACAVAFVLL